MLRGINIKTLFFATIVSICMILPVQAGNQYTGNEVYSSNQYIHDFKVWNQLQYYRRYENGFFVEITHDTFGNDTHAGVGYQHYKDGITVDIKISNDYSILQLLKRF